MKGQILLITILVMAVGLAIGLAVVQRSLSDISTASKIEQSSRAFSAAEAGIEKALGGTGTSVSFSDNFSSAAVLDSGMVPQIPASGVRQKALEYAGASKEEVTQFWLADYNTLGNLTASPYTQGLIDVYWGNPCSGCTDKAAIEVTVVYFDSVSSSYKNTKSYFDSDSLRASQNKFSVPTSPTGNCGNPATDTVLGDSRSFYCIQEIATPANTILIRTRLLYNNTNHPVAMQGRGTCGSACSLIPQARILTSTGTSGETQRKVQLFRLEKIVPPYFDYAIFSAGEINK